MPISIAVECSFASFSHQVPPPNGRWSPRSRLPAVTGIAILTENWYFCCFHRKKKKLLYVASNQFCQCQIWLVCLNNYSILIHLQLLFPAFLALWHDWSYGSDHGWNISSERSSCLMIFVCVLYIFQCSLVCSRQVYWMNFCCRVDINFFHILSFFIFLPTLLFFF